MINNLSDDPDMPEDDAPVKVAYHTAPISDDSDKSEDRKISESESDPEQEEEKDPLDDEEPSADAKAMADKEDSETEEEDEKNDPLDDEGSEEDPEKDETEPVIEKQEAKISSSDPNLYYLQTVKTGDQPDWQKPEEELDIFHQPLDDGLIQYWAYPKDLDKTADSVPNAEAIALKNKSDNPVIIIDQVKDHLTPGCCLELILAKNGHALAKTDSNLDNLEANITSLIDLAKMNFGITAEHFVSTSNVSSEVEKRLDDLEDAGDDEKEETKATEPESNFQQASVYNQETSSLSPDKPVLASSNSRSKLVVLIPVLVLIILAIVMIFFRDNLLSVINPQSQEVALTPTPTQAPTPTPTVAIDRSKYTVRVLNGTPTSGAAGTLATKLKALGWLIDRTGNATSSAVAVSYIRSKVGTDEVTKLLTADVTDYVATPSAIILPPSDKADLEFVIGKK